MTGREADVELSGGWSTLAGTLRLPEGDGPAPAVLLLPGSGPIDRDSNHRRARIDVTRQLADALAAHGFASLRYDKRGAGASPGDWRRAGLHDNIDDAHTALRFLRAQPGIDARAVFIAGHSEGAVIAAALAKREPKLAGLVLLSPSVRNGQDNLLWQVRTIAPTLPAPVRLLLRTFRVDLAAKVARNHDKLRASTGDVVRLGGARTNAKWFREYLDHDPGEDLAATTVPVLGITGSKDLQVDPADLQRLATVAGGPVDVHEIPDLTHVLRRQPGTPSLRSYKREIREPVDPEVIDIVVRWLGEHLPTGDETGGRHG